MSKKIPKYTFRILKVILIILLFGAIYQQLAVKHNFYEILENFDLGFSYFSFFLLSMVLLLMPINLNIEALKWRKLIQVIEQIPQLKAFWAICTGITLSMFTPNRIGEFGGRVLLLQKASKLEGAAISLVGSLSQLVASFSIGFVGLLGFILLFKVFSFQVGVAMLGTAILLIGLLSFFYFNIGLLYNILAKNTFLSKYAQHLKPILSFSNKLLAQALFLSIIRHFVFSFQYILVFWLLGIGIETSFLCMLILVLSIFFVQTVFPSIALIELGIRSSIAIYFMEYIGANPLEVIIASLLLWCINLMLPSLIGLLVLMNINLRKQIFTSKN